MDQNLDNYAIVDNEIFEREYLKNPNISIIHSEELGGKILIQYKKDDSPEIASNISISIYAAITA
jgi:hypothetical protein